MDIKQRRIEKPEQYKKRPNIEQTQYYTYNVDYTGMFTAAGNRYLQKLFNLSIKERWSRNRFAAENRQRDPERVYGEIGDTDVREALRYATEYNIWIHKLRPWPGNFGDVPLMGTTAWEEWKEGKGARGHPGNFDSGIHATEAWQRKSWE